jgi:hypothetical protein
MPKRACPVEIRPAAPEDMAGIRGLIRLFRRQLVQHNLLQAGSFSVEVSGERLAGRCALLYGVPSPRHSRHSRVRCPAASDVAIARRRVNLDTPSSPVNQHTSHITNDNDRRDLFGVGCPAHYVYYGIDGDEEGDGAGCEAGGGYGLQPSREA